ncbi:MAG: hypothetical protein KR126chlam6_01406 [Candidatus Anoxychlamydiales bacterium]|nr:hypothetical protein [Candidatus Anoxychlamydiales bacterium]
MQQVLKKIFLIDEKVENHIKFWVLLGPFFLFLSVSLATFELKALVAISLFFCYRFKFKGLYISLIALICFSFYTQVNLETENLWNLGLEFSIALGLITTAFGLDEIRKLKNMNSTVDDSELKTLKSEFLEKQKIFENTEKNLNDNLNILNIDLDKKQNIIEEFTKDLDAANRNLHESVQSKDYLLNELDAKVKQIDELQVKQDELYEKLSYLKDEEFLLEKNQNIQKELENLKVTYENIKTEKAKFLTYLTDKDRKIQELETKNQSLIKNEDVEKLNSEIKVFQDKINLLEQEKSSLNQDLQKVDNFKSEINEKAVVIKDLETRLQNSIKKEYFDALKLKLEDSEKKVTEFQPKDIDQNSAIIDELNKKNEKQHQLIEKLKSEKSKEQKFENITDQTLLDEYEAKSKKFKRLDSLYNQLKDQFEDKQLVLHKTRQELFEVNEKLTAYQREKKSDCKDFTDNEKALLKDLDHISGELSTYKEENQNLQSLITDLLEKNKTSNKEKLDDSEEQLSV